jgi:hypothetical protein
MSLSDEIKADALEAQKYSRKHLVLELDFSEASVKELEENADTVEFAIPGGKSMENVEMLARTWGAYVGESLRRRCGGQWTREPDGRIALVGSSGRVHPQEQVRRRLLEGHAFKLDEFFTSALSKLA